MKPNEKNKDKPKITPEMARVRFWMKMIPLIGKAMGRTAREQLAIMQYNVEREEGTEEKNPNKDKGGYFYRQFYN